MGGERLVTEWFEAQPGCKQLPSSLLDPLPPFPILLLAATYQGHTQPPADPPQQDSCLSGLWAVWGGFQHNLSFTLLLFADSCPPLPSLPLCGQEDGDPVLPAAPGVTTQPGAGSPTDRPPK